ncbi:MAG: hypothetical protein II995_01485 [Oscillospiraceae bacterium]|nr:hypothetical protein [Oscillospiraceae bacterium]
MENEMKALAEGLALFLTPDITLSGIFKDGFSLFKFADRFDFTLPERNTAQRDNGKAVFTRIYQSFFSRYAAAESGGQTSYNAPRKSAFGEAGLALQGFPILKAVRDSIVMPKQSGFFTEFPLRERVTGVRYDQSVIKSEKAASPAEGETAAVIENVKNIETDAVPVIGQSRLEISRIGDALGEQLHQKLAAGYPMYVR